MRSSESALSLSLGGLHRSSLSSVANRTVSRRSICDSRLLRAQRPCLAGHDDLLCGHGVGVTAQEGADFACCAQAIDSRERFCFQGRERATAGELEVATFGYFGAKGFQFLDQACASERFPAQ
jgi:hypothetical protein